MFTETSRFFWAALGTWCIYQIVQALRCLYYVMCEPWVLEQEDEEDD